MRSIHLTTFSILVSVFCGIAQAMPIPDLSVREKDQLRYRLENIWNEVDLLSRNERIDRSDLKRLERDLGGLGVYQKIPLETAGSKPTAEAFRSELTPSIQASGLKLESVKVVAYPTRPDFPVPKKIKHNEAGFRFTPSQLAGEYQLEVTLEGRRQELLAWIADWKETKKKVYPPLLNWTHGKRPTAFQVEGPNRWTLFVTAYRFRPILFPQVLLPEPRKALPPWAQANPKTFARHEPLLWSFIERAEKVIPKTPHLYETRGQFILNAARMSFFQHQMGRD